MANSITADFLEVWAREQQTVFHKANVAESVADVSFNSVMSRGDTLNRPYRAALRPQAYVRGTDITIDDITDTQEQLSVDSEYAMGIYLDAFDKIQSNYDLAASYGKDMGIYLANQVDADVLGEYSNASATVDDGTLGGTAGQSISLTTSNVLSVFGEAKEALMKANVPDTNLWACLSPDFENVLTQYGAGRDTNMGDQGTMNGFFGNFYGFKLYRSNQLSGTAVLALATTPTDTDTVVIEGVTFTFVTVIGTTAGNVLIGGSADAARLNLTTLINAPGTTTAEGVALSAANQRLFVNATATNDAAANTMTLEFKGVGNLTVSETLTDVTDTWTATLTAQHCLFGAGGGTTLVMQQAPKLQYKEEPKLTGGNILASVLYGYKTFTDGADRLVDVSVRF